MVVRVFFIVLSYVCFHQAVAAAPSFDCAKANSLVEKAVCNSPRLSQLDQQLATTYASKMSDLVEDDQKQLRSDQRHWLARLPKDCSIEEVCLLAAYAERVRTVAAWASSGPDDDVSDYFDTTEKTPAAKKVCNAVFARKNITWDRGLIVMRLPARFQRPQGKEGRADDNYRVMKLSFDFRNIGKKETVYKIDHFEKYYGCCSPFGKHYLVVDSKDQKYYQRKFDAGDDRDEDLAQEANSPTLDEMVQKIIESESNMKEGITQTATKPFGRSSFLYSLTGHYDKDNKTDPEYDVFIYDNATYVLSHRQLLLLRPNRAGTFDEVCRHKPIFSPQDYQEYPR